MAVPQTPLGELIQRSPDPLAGLMGPTSKGREEKGREWKVRGRRKS